MMRKTYDDLPRGQGRVLVPKTAKSLDPKNPGWIWAFNDACETKHQDVLHVFDLALWSMRKCWVTCRQSLVRGSDMPNPERLWNECRNEILICSSSCGSVDFDGTASRSMRLCVDYRP